MEKIRDMSVAEAFPPFLRVRAGDIPGGAKIVELLSVFCRDGVHPAAAGQEEVPCKTALCRIVGLQVNGEVCAGFPSPAEEELRDVISFDEYLVAHPETSFLLSVTGDSMIGAGIMEKDLVIVERGRQPKNGDIILAEVDGNWTMKYFCKKGKAITLEAANPKYSPIVPQTELRIAGVITALVRKYK
jgi:SOS regulatory protein LexA